MVASAQDAIAAYIATGGYGTVGSSIFVDWLPPTVANCVVATGYTGSPTDRVIGQKLPGVQYPKVQVLVRNTDPSTALTNIIAIGDYLEGAAFTASGYTIKLMYQTSSGALYLGKDANNWTSYSINFDIIN